MMDSEEVHDERDRLFYDLIIRLSSLEGLLLSKKIISARELAESQAECMSKLKEFFESKQNEEENKSSNDEESK